MRGYSPNINILKNKLEVVVRGYSPNINILKNKPELGVCGAIAQILVTYYKTSRSRVCERL